MLKLQRRLKHGYFISTRDLAWLVISLTFEGKEGTGGYKKMVIEIKLSMSSLRQQEKLACCERWSVVDNDRHSIEVPLL